MAVESGSFGNGRRNGKSVAAFRTISEVADDLEVPPHVLRFWETKFTQVKPLKRGGGRRYYRPEDVALLRRIRELLYGDGYTIKGVQRLLKDGGGKLRDDDAPEISPVPSNGEAAEVDPNQVFTRSHLDDSTRNGIVEVLEELIALKKMLSDARQR